MNEIERALAGSALFRGVSPSLIQLVATSAETRTLGAAERLLVVGQSNHTLYIVISGSVTVRVGDIESPIVTLAAGECIGELSLLDGRAASADVIAEEPTWVLLLDQEQLWALIETSAELGRNLLRVLAGRVRNDNSVLAESHRLKRHFEQLATIDGLTGLRNRRWLDEAFPRQLQRTVSRGQAASILMIDIDHFKQLNDRHGHALGDAVLARVGRVLVSVLRPQDLVARYGGEEFSVLLPAIAGDEALLVAERLRQAVQSAPRDTDAGDLPAVTVSVGVAANRKDDTLPILLARADEALYRAKHAGRNRTST